jgi:hypothetical protein
VVTISSMNWWTFMICVIPRLKRKFMILQILLLALAEIQMVIPGWSKECSMMPVGVNIRRFEHSQN